MRRCYLLLPFLLVCGACAETPIPSVGVVVSVSAGHAAKLVAEEQQPGESGHFEAAVAALTSATSAEEAIRVANGYVHDDAVVAVIGHSNSATSLAASQIYNAAGLVQIAPTTTAPVYSRAGPYSFRLVPSDTLQAGYLLTVLQHHWPGAKRIAIVHVNDDYGRGLLREIRPRLENVVFEEPYGDGFDSTDVAMLARRIAAREPDLIFWLGRSGTLGMLLPSLRELLPGIVAVCSDACDTSPVYGNDDGRYTGVYFVRFTNPAAADPDVLAFQKRYRKVTGQSASSEALLTYDAVSLVRTALRDGARTREDIRRYLLSLGRERPAYRGLTGEIRFDSAGTAARTYMLAKVGTDSVGSAEHTMRYRYR